MEFKTCSAIGNTEPTGIQKLSDYTCLYSSQDDHVQDIEQEPKWDEMVQFRLPIVNEFHHLV